MPTEAPSRILVVANRTASTPAMLGEVQRRAAAGARFALLIPPVHADDPTDWSSADACDLLRRAGAADVEEVDGGDDAALRVHELVRDKSCDEVIVSTVHHHLDRWRHHDLPRRLADLSVPVTVIPPEPQRWGPIEGFPPDWVPGAASPAGMAGFGNY
jgi:hypothetical protein